MRIVVKCKKGMPKKSFNYRYVSRMLVKFTVRFQDSKLLCYGVCILLYDSLCWEKGLWKKVY
jgi:hypothetical protein